MKPVILIFAGLIEKPFFQHPLKTTVGVKLFLNLQIAVK
jgi:hypothetical protein